MAATWFQRAAVGGGSIGNPGAAAQPGAVQQPPSSRAPVQPTGRRRIVLCRVLETGQWQGGFQAGGHGHGGVARHLLVDGQLAVRQRPRRHPGLDATVSTSGAAVNCPQCRLQRWAGR